MSATESRTGDSVVPPEPNYGVPSDLGAPRRSVEGSVVSEQLSPVDVACQQTVECADRAVQCELDTSAYYDDAHRQHEERMESLRRMRAILQEILHGPSNAEN
ncbi:hypothetical protein HPB50_028467 [Hyalomma asiaticum]|nr:hypothetical protein HPB50_028467 [Hyalomma asiaticum]